jgi:hypothetical protein
MVSLLQCIGQLMAHRVIGLMLGLCSVLENSGHSRPARRMDWARMTHRDMR